MLIDEETDGEFVAGGRGGTVGLLLPVPFAPAAALRFGLLLVFVRPKP